MLVKIVAIGLIVPSIAVKNVQMRIVKMTPKFVFIDIGLIFLLGLIFVISGKDN